MAMEQETELLRISKCPFPGGLFFGRFAGSLSWLNGISHDNPRTGAVSSGSFGKFRHGGIAYA
jgi:hypothetical protein